MNLNDISYAVRGAAFSVHSALGPGLLESAYEDCLEYELKRNGLRVDRQICLPLRYHDLVVDNAFRIDLLVENQVVVELKAVHELTPQHTAQLLTYLKLSEKKLGLLINFHCSNLQRGIKRFVL